MVENSLTRKTPISEVVSLLLIGAALYINYVGLQTAFSGLFGFDDVVVFLVLFFQFFAFLLSLPFFLRVFKAPLFQIYNNLMFTGYGLNSVAVFIIIILVGSNLLGYIVFFSMGFIQLIPAIKIIRVNK